MIIGLISVQGVLNYLTVMQEREKNHNLYLQKISIFIYFPLLALGVFTSPSGKVFISRVFLLSQPEA